jgi:hypothetical protein
MKFTLTIDMGNDGMLSGSDLAGALRYVAARVQDVSPGGPHATLTEPDSGGKVVDRNGNGVGRWMLVSDE